MLKDAIIPRFKRGSVGLLLLQQISNLGETHAHSDNNKVSSYAITTM